MLRHGAADGNGTRPIGLRDMLAAFDLYNIPKWQHISFVRTLQELDAKHLSCVARQQERERKAQKENGGRNDNG